MRGVLARDVFDSPAYAGIKLRLHTFGLDAYLGCVMTTVPLFGALSGQFACFHSLSKSETYHGKILNQLEPHHQERISPPENQAPLLRPANTSG